MARYPKLDRWPVIGLDTETTGLVYPRDRAFGFAITADGFQQYWDLRKTPNAGIWLAEALSSYNGVVVCHNASFDYLMLKAAGVQTPLHLYRDTAIRACLIDEHVFSYDLDTLASIYLGDSKKDSIYTELADLFGGIATKNVQMRNIANAPPEVVGPYCMKDADLCRRLYLWQEQEIEEQGIREIVDFEEQLMPTIIRVQEKGVRVDLDRAAEAMDKLTPLIQESQFQLNQLAGFEVNVNSGPQIKKIFNPKQHGGSWYTEDGFPLPMTPKGGPSIGSAVLREMGGPVAESIIEIRSLIKTRDTFLRGHVIGHSVGGRVYPNINQAKGEDGGTGTGRLSYTDPALQQIPSRNKRVAAIVKPCFLPEEGEIWCDTDMDTFEVRVFIHLARVKKVIEAYHRNPDLDGHGYVSELTGLVRNAEYSGQPNAKQLNLSMIFNQGRGATAEKMGMPWSWDTFEVVEDGRTKVIRYKKPGVEAEAAIAKYHKYMPGVKELAERAKNLAIGRGYVKTARGRRLRFPNGFKAYKASGLAIQATAADLNKENWMLIEQELGDQGRLILNTHDSYGLSLREDTWREAFGRVKAAIERDGRIRVPLRLGLSGCGHNWWEALNDQLGANGPDKG